MAENDSFSSSTSTISYHSLDDTDEASFNTSGSRSRTLSGASSNSSSEAHVYPLYRGESISTVDSNDSNLDNVADIIADDISKWRSGLYDISLDILMDMPWDENFNKPDMLRATVYTIVGEVFFKHKQWMSISGRIAHHMGKTLNPTSSIWTLVTGKRFIYRGKTNISGHVMTIPVYAEHEIVHDIITFSDQICSTNVKLKYSVEVFLTPAVVGADKIYKRHGFNYDYDPRNYKEKHMDDVFMNHEMEKLEVYDHHLAWASVYNVLEEYRKNVGRQNRFFEEYGFSF